jgi:hypothetical protein
MSPSGRPSGDWRPIVQRSLFQQREGVPLADVLAVFPSFAAQEHSPGLCWHRSREGCYPLQGTKAPRHQGTKAPRHQGTKAPRHQGTKAPRHQGTKAPRQLKVIKRLPELRHRSVGSIRKNRSTKAAIQRPLNHLQGNLPLRAVAHTFWNARLFQAVLVTRPRLWQIEICINAGHTAVNLVLKRDSDLAVANFAKCAAVLPCDADGMLPLLGKASVVDDQHPLAAQLPSNPLPHVFADKRIFPVALIYKLLESLNVIFRWLINGGSWFTVNWNLAGLCLRDESRHRAEGSCGILPQRFIASVPIPKGSRGGAV